VPVPNPEPAVPAPPVPLVPGFVPLHHQVYAALSSGLANGQWRPGDRMPTERELASDFGCSLITIRRALDELVREHRIVRIRGKGTFATSQPVDRELAALTSFTDEMTTRGLDPRTAVTRARLSEASPAISDALGIRPGTAVYDIERVRSAGGEPLMIEQVQLPAHLVPGLLDHDFATASLYDLLADEYGIVLERGHESVEPALPDAREAELLGQDRTSPVLVLQLVSSTADGHAVEYCRSVVRGDRARYHLEVRRRGAHLSIVPTTPPPEN
jgi:GntR family transcriptional regulator